MHRILDDSSSKGARARAQRAWPPQSRGGRQGGKRGAGRRQGIAQKLWIFFFGLFAFFFCCLPKWACIVNTRWRGSSGDPSGAQTVLKRKREGLKRRKEMKRKKEKRKRCFCLGCRPIEPTCSARQKQKRRGIGIGERSLRWKRVEGTGSCTSRGTSRRPGTWPGLRTV